MQRSLIAFCLVFLATPPVWAVTTHTVAPRDTDQFIAALCAAQEGQGLQIIELAQGSRYEFSALARDWSWRPGSPLGDDEKFNASSSSACTFHGPPWYLQVAGQLTIRGNGSVLDLNNHFGFFVEEQASLLVEDLVIEKSRIFGAVYNQGDLELNRVTLRDGKGIHDESTGDSREFPLPVRAAGVNNFGNLIARNVYIEDNKFRVPGWDPEASCPDAVGGIYNAGFASINNATFYRNTSIAVCGGRSIFNAPQGTVEVSNTLLGRLAPNVCLGNITSLGYNFEGAAQSCGLDGPGDISTEIGGYNVTTAFAPGEIIYPVVFSWDIRELGSPASSGPGSCEIFDMRGYARASAETGRCDLGATEVGARGAPGEFAGTWLKPSKDGHYLSITQLREQLVLLIWNTFDDKAKRLWVYGIGTRAGREVVVEAYQNTGGRVTPNGLVPADAEPWGELRFKASSCADGTFTYTANDSGQGSGELQLVRVAKSDQLQCVDF